MPFVPITPLPAVPNAASEPETFSDDADTFLSALPAWAAQVNAGGAHIDAVGALVDSQSTAAVNAAAAAASVQAIVVSAANFKGNYSALTGALAVPASVYHNGNYWQLLTNTSNVAADVPGVSNKWALASNPAGYVAISTPFTITYAGRYLVIGNGDVTLPNPNVFADGVGFEFVRELASTPALVTVTDGFKWRGGLDNRINMTGQFVGIVVRGSKYEV